METYTVTPADIDRYGKTCEKIRELTGEKDQLRPRLLTHISVKGELPVGEQFVVKHVPVTQKDIDWRMEAILLAEKVYGKTGALEWEQKTLDSAASTTTYRLTSSRLAKK